MSKRKVKILSALAAAGLAGVSGLASSARAGVTLTQGYISGQISSTSNFAGGTTTAVTLTAAGPNNISLPVDDFFRFGITEVVTGDTNPVSGDAWDVDNSTNQGNLPQPAQLGLLGIAIQVPSTDSAGSKLVPLSSSGNSKAVLPSQTTMGWSIETPGTVSGGNVGTPTQLSGGATAIADAGMAGAASSTTADAPLTDFTSTGPDPSLFTGLAYSALGSGTVTLSPTIFSNGTQYWVATNLGTVAAGGDTDAAYGGQFFGTNDTIKPLAAINITIGTLPEPASLGLLSVGGLALLARRNRKARA